MIENKSKENYVKMTKNFFVKKKFQYKFTIFKKNSFKNNFFSYIYQIKISFLFFNGTMIGEF
jgi:hypothetical protein